MSMLPVFAIPLIWSALQVPPTSSAEVDAKAEAVARYFNSRLYMDHRRFSAFDHDVPHTTNLAEGFHNSLNTRFGMPHPSMRTFMNWLQKCQLETQCMPRTATLSWSTTETACTVVRPERCCCYCCSKTVIRRQHRTAVRFFLGPTVGQLGPVQLDDLRLSGSYQLLDWRLTFVRRSEL